MHKVKFIFGILLSFLLVFASSCTGNSSTGDQARIYFAWSPWPGDYTVLVASKMNAFQNFNLTVEPIRYDSSTKAISDLAGGKLDGGIFSMSDFLLAANISDVETIMVSDNADKFSIVASPTIQNVNDLRGKRIGINLHTSSEMLLTDILKRQRMTPGDVNYVEMSPSQVLEGFPDQIDAGLVWEPFTSLAVQQGLHVIYQNDYYSSLVPRLIVFRKTFIETHPDEIRAFLQAWDEAVKYRNAYPSESRSLIGQGTKLSKDQLSLTDSIPLLTRSDNISLFSENSASDTGSIIFAANFNADFLLTFGYITDRPNLDTLLNSSFLQ